eukprot:6948-Heterococcus_DN1.PRE.4
MKVAFEYNLYDYIRATDLRDVVELDLLLWCSGHSVTEVMQYIDLNSYGAKHTCKRKCVADYCKASLSALEGDAEMLRQLEHKQCHR